MRIPTHDVLVIGAGLAGQRAALAAAEEGASVGILSKVHPVRSHSNAAQGGINAALNPEDSWESHAFDTVKGSDYLGDQDAIEVMCREAPDEILTLEHLGVTFHRNEEGRLGTRAFGGASAARTYYVADITGQAILHVLYEQLMKHDEVHRYEEWFTTNLVRDDDGHVAGCVARQMRDGTMELFAAKIVNVGRDFAGVDITREPIHIKPGNHYTMGGVKTDKEGHTDIPGLYAAGEVACVSVHGGNRLGANSLLDTLVFGRRSGKDAAEHARNHKLPDIPRAVVDDEERGLRELIGRERSGRRVSEIREELGRTLDKSVAVFRDEDGLREAAQNVQRLNEEAKSIAIDDKGQVFNQDLFGALELGFMLDNAECVVVAALERKESRGAQFRTDFPERDDDEWLTHVDLTMDGDSPGVTYSQVTITRWQPEERKY